MGKKVREYKSGDFIFAKVKGYPAWPARVQGMNGKKYFVYFYGTGETANLPPNMIFDYAENKDKFLTKTGKRKDFNNGVKQIEHDFANNVPLEDVIGITVEVPPADAGNDTVNESTANDTMDDTAADTTANDETMADDTTLNTTQNDTAVDDSDDTGNLVIDEAKLKQGRKSKADVKGKETPKPLKEAKTPRGKKKDDIPKEDEEEKKEEEIVSRSGRKIRPKRYIDEQTEENATLPSPAHKKRRASPAPAQDKADNDSADAAKDKLPDKNIKQFNAVTQSELEDLKEPFKSEDAEKENILIAYLPAGQYVGIKLFQSRPNSFKNEAARLQWDKQAASNAITLKMQLEKGQITSQSVVAQLVTDLNLTDEEKATLDKQRETEEKKSRVQFLKTEMKLIELDAKIKTCLCLEKADTDQCLKLLDDLMELDVAPLMLLKHPTCLETVKRMRAYVGNTPSWELSEAAALAFSKQAHRIRKQADTLYNNLKMLFPTPDGLSFWEYFTERVLHFKKVTSKLSANELLELMHEPLEMSVPTPHTMKAAVEAANEEEQKESKEQKEPKQQKEPKEKKEPKEPKERKDQPPPEPAKEEEPPQKKNQKTPAKSKKSNNTPSKPVAKRQSSRNQKPEEKDKEDPPKPDDIAEEAKTTEEPPSDKSEQPDQPTEQPETETTKDNTTEDMETDKTDKENGEVDKQDSTEKSESIDKETVDKETDVVKETKDKVDEPRAKRSRESKKTEPPPPRSPAKRKSKF